ALALANAYLASFPDRSRALELKARALAGLARWPEAARVFDKIGAEQPAGQRAWSLSLLHTQRWSEALPLLIELHEQRPLDADILHELAACYSQLGDH